jgi:hypothetical protein
MVFRLSLLLLYILPPILLAWYWQASSHHPSLLTTTTTSLPSFFHSIMGGWEEPPQQFVSNHDDEGYHDDHHDNDEDLMRYDWHRRFYQERQSYYSKVVVNGSMGNNYNTNDSITMIHVIILMHGWLGNPFEMDSIKESLQTAIEQISTTQKGESTSTTTTTSATPNQLFVVHSAICNDGKTNDGIHAGGVRLAHEINSLLRFIVQDNLPSQNNNDNNFKITLSICGNSLGGLYARRALANIQWNVVHNINNNKKHINENVGNDAQHQQHHQQSSSTTSFLSSSVITPIIPLLFVTTATPHLGISQHTYIRLPRVFEYPIAQLLNQTGRDLFGYTSVLEDLTMQDRFIQPLQHFQQRMAYANVYGTDFSVPTPTAAFWARHSDSPHYVVVVEEDTNHYNNYENNNNNNDAKDMDDVTENIHDHNDNKDMITTSTPSYTSKRKPPNMIVMTLTTPQRPQLQQPNNNKSNPLHDKGDDDDDDDNEIDNNDEVDPMQRRFQEWSQRLDRLGWTKVLVDMREHVPQVSVWSKLSSSSSSLSNSNDDVATSPSNRHQKSRSNHHNNNNSNNKSHNKTWWTAQELLHEFERAGDGDVVVMRIPLGHTIMVANAKDKLNKWLNMGGKPVMDWLAGSMIQTIQEQEQLPQTILHTT